MDRAKAQELYGKLLALADPARGGTPAERAVAQAKADVLAERFGLSPDTPASKPSGIKTPDRFAPFREWRRWAFDPATGARSGNVKVIRHNSRRDWRIEIDVAAESEARRKHYGLDKPDRRKLSS